MTVAGLVLAAGGASRFGSPKQLAQLDGRPLVAHALDALAGLDDVVVVVGAHADAVARAVEDRARVVRCEKWSEGLAASVRSGVRALADADRVVVVLADQPRVTRAVVERVLAAPAPARASYGGVPGHPVVLGRAQLALADRLEGDTGFRDLLTDASLVEVGDLGDPRDVDTPGDLEALRR